VSKEGVQCQGPRAFGRLFRHCRVFRTFTCIRPDLHGPPAFGELLLLLLLKIVIYNISCFRQTLHSSSTAKTALLVRIAAAKSKMSNQHYLRRRTVQPVNIGDLDMDPPLASSHPIFDLPRLTSNLPHQTLGLQRANPGLPYTNPYLPQPTIISPGSMLKSPRPNNHVTYAPMDPMRLRPGLPLGRENAEQFRV